MNIGPTRTFALTALLIGLIIGAIVGACLGGAAAMGLTLFEHSVSGFALFATATIGTAVAGTINYQFSSMAYGRKTNVEGYLISGIEGFVEGTIAFALGGLAGIHGYFNHAEQSILKPRKILETICRLVLFGIPSVLVRTGIKETINSNWGLNW